MKKIFITGLFAFPALLINAQNQLERSITPFTKINVSGVAKVIYTPSDTLRLKLTGDNKHFENVETRVENNTLFVDMKGNNNEDKVIVMIHNQHLNDVECSGASSFRTMNALKEDSLHIGVSGAANASVKAEVRAASVAESGAGSLSLSGSGTTLLAELSGAANLKAYQFIAKDAKVITTGATTAKVYVSERINANASGASSIKIKGEVKDVSAEASTSSSITRIMDKDSKDKNDSTKFSWNGKKVIIIAGDKDKDDDKKKSDGPDFDHWAGFAVGVNGFLTPNAQVKMDPQYNYLDLNYSRSINFQLNFFQHNFNLYKNYVNLVTGFGIEWRRYMFDNKTSLNADSSFTHGVIDNTSTYNYRKNLFKSTMLQVPLLLDFNTSSNPRKSFHISTGVIGQFLVNSKTKQIFDYKGDEFTRIRKDSYNQVPWNLKAHASIGYSSFTMFAEYNITRLFYKDQGAQVYPFVAGIRLVAF